MADQADLTCNQYPVLSAMPAAETSTAYTHDIYAEPPATMINTLHWPYWCVTAKHTGVSCGGWLAAHLLGPVEVASTLKALSAEAFGSSCYLTAVCCLALPTKASMRRQTSHKRRLTQRRHS